MFNKKRGESKTVATVLSVIFGAFILAFLIMTVVNWNQGALTSIQLATDGISNFSMKVIKPLLGFLLDLDHAEKGNEFLMVLAFILVAIIVVGTLDSVNLFGEDGTARGDYINLAVGIIVSIIGVRYMPSDLWASMTAPSSAFVATILIGLPFLAMFFVTRKIKMPVVRKFVWGFYLVFVVYLTVTGENPSSINTAYGIFAVLAGLMIVLDVRIRRWMNTEFLGKKTVDDVKADYAALRIGELTNDVGRLNESKKSATGIALININKQIKTKEKQIKDLAADVE